MGATFDIAPQLDNAGSHGLAAIAVSDGAPVHHYPTVD